MAQPTTSPRPHRPASPDLSRWAAAVACVVAGVRILLVAHWGGDAPYLDEWNTTGLLHAKAGAGALAIPWAWVFTPHVEHLLATQRFFSLAVTALNGLQWDARLELVIGALLWGLFAGGITALFGRELHGLPLFGWSALVAGAEAIPHAWENLLWAFQIQFLLLIGFSLLAVWLLSRTRAFSAAWWGGTACGVAACLSQASGLIVWVTAIAITILQMIKQPHLRYVRSLLALGFYCTAAVLARCLIPHVPHHEVMHAHDFGTWAHAASSLLAWPWSAWPWLALLLWSPGAVFLVRLILRSAPLSHTQLGLSAALVWSLAMAGASAWARGALLVQGVPPSRYADVLVIAALMNGCVLLSWVGSLVSWRRAAAVGAIAWLAVLFSGLIFYTVQLSRTATQASVLDRLSLREFVASRAPQADALRKYVRTRDPADLAVQPYLYPVKEHLAIVVDQVQAAGRWPATLSPNGDGRLPWLSRAARAAGTWGWGLVVAGFALAAHATFREFRSANRRDVLCAGG